VARQARKKSRSGVYHIMLRGVNRQQIFGDDEDCEAFLLAMKRFFSEGGHRVYAYCLMGNHAHIVLREGKETIDLAIRKLGTSYVLRYNKKYARTGPLFQDRYRSEPVEDAQRLVDAVRYVHMNPVKAGLCGSLGDYPWSSCRAYERGEDPFIRTRDVLVYVDGDALLATARDKESSAFAESAEPHDGVSEARARAIVGEVIGADASAFGRLDGERKAQALRILSEKGLSASQICRLTGTSYALARRYQQDDG
jgi:REP element-mobilizing transposase RayT